MNNESQFDLYFSMKHTFLSFIDSTANHVNRSSANYKIIIPISMSCSFISIFISCLILILIYSKNNLHAIKYILICNTCIATILSSLIQINNYLNLIFLSNHSNDFKCRCRAYLSYMSISSVIYSYFIQALSRYCFSVYHTNLKWILSFRFHYILIFIQWIVVVLIPLPSLLTNDIYYRPTFLCWVPREKFSHVLYTLFAYYLIPTMLIVGIYIKIFFRIKNDERHSLKSIRKIKQNRNLKLLRNILILIAIYTCGGIPTLIYVFIKIEVFYSLGIIFLSLFITIEKVMTILIDKEIKTNVKLMFFPFKMVTTVISEINYNQNYFQSNPID